jgi:endogenous inhibitor of DNA gyrase (YacG/DUF329 family)
MMARTKPCPLCGKTPDVEHAPFCSRGCRDRDLLKWLGEGYTIPAGTPDDADNLEHGHETGLDSGKKPA